MVTSDDDDDDVESVIYYPKNPSCTLYVTLNVKKNSKIGRVFDRWQKRETTQNSSHIESARPSVALKHTSSYYYSLSLPLACERLDFEISSSINRTLKIYYSFKEGGRKAY